MCVVSVTVSRGWGLSDETGVEDYERGNEIGKTCKMPGVHVVETRNLGNMNEKGDESFKRVFLNFLT